jgi:hypothetical protein
MNILNLTAQFPDEASCKARWKEYREQEREVCPYCGNKEHYWKSDREEYECRRCKYRQSFKFNTVMHGSQLPFRYWFVAIHSLTSTKIDSDHSTSYTNFSQLVKEHRPRVIPKKEVETIFSCVHIAISNAKRMLLDIFHDIKSEYLQNYLNEFCYKFNRRYFSELRFDRLMIAAFETKNQLTIN